VVFAVDSSSGSNSAGPGFSFPEVAIDTATAPASPPTRVPPVTGDPISTNFDVALRTHTATFGVTYKFSGSGGPFLAN